jgi:hypothetical protein
MFKYIPSIILTQITGKMFWNATELELGYVLKPLKYDDYVIALKH